MFRFMQDVTYRWLPGEKHRT